MSITDYQLYRGKCLEMSQEAILANPDLTLVRGHYFCPIWNKDEPHWWTIKSDGTVYDPSAKQFPSAGLGIYTPFDGILNCSNCDKKMKEEDAQIDGNYAFCCTRCHGIFVVIF